MKRLLTLDQSTKVTGYSVFDDKKLVRYGCASADDDQIFERFFKMYEKIDTLIDIYKPDIVCFEGVQNQGNSSTFMQLSRLQGLVMAILFNRDIQFYIIEPSAWKSTLGVKGRKRAEQKQSCIEIVKEKFNINPTEDEADAIGIGFYCVENLEGW